MTQVTLKQERLAKEYTKALADQQVPTKQEILNRAGYLPNNRDAFSKDGFRIALMREMEKQGITDEKISKKLNQLLDHKSPSSIDKGLTHILKITGGYAPKQQETTISGSVDHKIESDNGDYMTYLMTKNKERTIIDGEIT